MQPLFNEPDVRQFGAQAFTQSGGSANILAQASADAMAATNVAVYRVPPGEAALTDTANANLSRGTTMPAPYAIRTYALTYVGSVSNVGGQTIQAQVYVNGSLIASSALGAATAGLHTILATIPSPAAGSAGDIITLAIDVGGGNLTAGITNISMSCGS